jgi:hypothetical protein
VTAATPFASATTAVEAIWTAGWTGETAPVRWHHNAAPSATPNAVSVSHWLHLAVEFDGETTAAFGGGRRARERELSGNVVIRVLAKRGLGEAELLRLLDKALTVFRGEATAPLSFIGDVVLRDPGASVDGIWHVRSAIAGFVYRFQG